ncbi:hypothetical protein [Nostoc sp. 'Peltigera membranacea cyanobiont' N6]|jgi:hypothetical protein|uniref:hypothetical protein n=1 Tax=Nostoc sp. 'Peltigera membranacea cyanobiont' N6 TaxID=1261031 RepID=UPI0015E2D59F|nr:hypothetical protein [Nostoc sp. 'Peltigera membranacea cyanobiont' N6]
MAKLKSDKTIFVDIPLVDHIKFKAIASAHNMTVKDAVCEAINIWSKTKMNGG